MSVEVFQRIMAAHADLKHVKLLGVQREPASTEYRFDFTVDSVPGVFTAYVSAKDVADNAFLPTQALDAYIDEPG